MTILDMQITALKRALLGTTIAGAWVEGDQAILAERLAKLLMEKRNADS